MVTGQRGVEYPGAGAERSIQRFVGEGAQPQQKTIAQGGRLRLQRRIAPYAALGFVIPLGIMLSTESFHRVNP